MKPCLSLLLLSLLFLSTACGQKSKSSKKVTKITEEQIQYVMDNQFIDCASIDGRACPNGMVRLLILNKENAEKSGVCSGFMVGPTTMVTNHHCIKSQKVCDNTYLVIHQDRTYTKNRCKTLHYTNQDTSNENDVRKKIDVSIVEVETPYDGEVFSPAPAKAVLGDQLTAWVVDQTGLDRKDKKEVNLHEFRITEFKCQVGDSKGFGSTVLINCPIIPGNSGSPVLNADGKVAGMIWGTEGQEFKPYLELSKRRALKHRALMTELEHFKEHMK